MRRRKRLRRQKKVYEGLMKDSTNNSQPSAL